MLAPARRRCALAGAGLGPTLHLLEVLVGLLEGGGVDGVGGGGGQLLDEGEAALDEGQVARAQMHEVRLGGDRSRHAPRRQAAPIPEPNADGIVDADVGKLAPSGRTRRTAQAPTVSCSAT